MSVRYVNARARFSCKGDNALALATYGKRTLDSDAKVWASLKRKGYNFQMKKRFFMEYEMAYNRTLAQHMDRLTMATAVPECTLPLLEKSSTLSLLEKSSTLSLLLMQ